MSAGPDRPGRPIIGVGSVVFNSAARVLLVRRAKPPKAGHWSLPGGRQKLGETAPETAAREVREETGLEIDLVGLLDVVDFIDRDAGGAIAHHYTLIDYLARWRSGEARPGGDTTEAAWWPLEALEALELWSQTRRVIALGAARLGLSAAEARP